MALVISKDSTICTGVTKGWHKECYSARSSLSFVPSSASHLTEVWLAVAENVPFARTMLHGLLGRLQSRFTARINATSKADIWRLAAVDPLMVSAEAGAGLPRELRVERTSPSPCRRYVPYGSSWRRWTRTTNSQTCSPICCTPSCCSLAAAMDQRLPHLS